MGQGKKKKKKKKMWRHGKESETPGWGSKPCRGGIITIAAVLWEPAATTRARGVQNGATQEEGGVDRGHRTAAVYQAQHHAHRLEQCAVPQLLPHAFTYHVQSTHFPGL